MRLAVLGSPISHSKSPVITLAAFRHLGVDATYDIVELSSGLARWLASDGSKYDCLSLTMPLKVEANALPVTSDAFAVATGSTNCLIRTSAGYSGYNTDGFGLVRATADVDFETVSILGTGATARTALQAFRECNRTIWGRDVDKALRLSERFGAHYRDLDTALEADLVISTLPIGVLPELLGSRQGAVLLDVAYKNPPVISFRSRVSGLEMLVWQAIGQLRLLLNGGEQFASEQMIHDVMLQSAMVGELPNA
jgi:shikimate dehydrogenase